VKVRIASLGEGENDMDKTEVTEKDFQLFLEFLAHKNKKRKGY
jgi:hypothetical protein